MFVIFPRNTNQFWTVMKKNYCCFRGYKRVWHSVTSRWGSEELFTPPPHRLCHQNLPLKKYFRNLDFPLTRKNAKDAQYIRTKWHNKINLHGYHFVRIPFYLLSVYVNTFIFSIICKPSIHLNVCPSIRSYPKRRSPKRRMDKRRSGQTSEWTLLK